MILKIYINYRIITESQSCWIYINVSDFYIFFGFIHNLYIPGLNSGRKLSHGCLHKPNNNNLYLHYLEFLDILGGYQYRLPIWHLLNRCRLRRSVCPNIQQHREKREYAPSWNSASHPDSVLIVKYSDNLHYSLIFRPWNHVLIPPEGVQLLHG